MEKPDFIHKAQQHILLFIFTLAPIITVFAGLVVAAFFIVIGLIPLYLLIKGKRHSALYASVPSKLFLLLLGWMALTIIWSIRPDKTFSWCTRLAAIYIGYIALVDYFSRLPHHIIAKLNHYMFVSLVIALALYAFEILSDGILIRFIRINLLAKDHYIYFPHDMNRGATFMVLCAWPMLYYLQIRYRSLMLTLCLWSLILITLLHLESLAATTGYVIGSLTFLMMACLRKHGMKAILTITALVITIIPITMALMNPFKLIESYPNIPASAQHRIHIWSFTATKALEQPFIGKGLGNSKYVEKQPSDWPGEHIDPLPSHPHNVIMQVWLELGVVGLIIYSLFVISMLWTLLHRKDQTPLTQNIAVSYMVSFLAISATAYNGWQSWWVSSFLMLSLFYFSPISNVAQKSSSNSIHQKDYQYL